ncbi:MAG TPA: hypothetical protein VMF08_17980 [Candidatus Sulfotelmatobacter sp.]|nr:hypothetical protein [Candidatus Sulfotelmatobacter sp.]
MQQSPLSSSMDRFLAALPRNIIGAFSGWKITLHLVAVVLTLILVTSGFDWFYFRTTMTIHWFSDFAAGVLIGTAIGMTVGKSFAQE